MNTQDYIINDVEPIGLEASIASVQDTFNQLTYSHVAILENGEYLGCLMDTDVHCFDADKTVADYRYAAEAFFVLEDTHWLDILEAFAVYGSNIMPVLDPDHKYLGYYELADIMHLFNDTPFLSETGGIIVVEKGQRDYSFSEICQIVEANEARLLGVFISHLTDDMVQATLKVGHSGINEIVQTFRRYDYEVISSHDEDKFIEDLKERSRYLDKYLNI
ncbi:CBS domain-containing protein [Aureitalea marina]|uniref:Acetoin utilization protein acuB n=1 Tax=Aureitalea marina TaxID=930804 RepID=A0A2S7KR86_9FLAO|nr:CBS domain-containing protein [Aureitalea marina]PQB05117.1 acetoin utilization protein acuB [Aureitalea marina]